MQNETHELDTKEKLQEKINNFEHFVWRRRWYEIESGGCEMKCREGNLGRMEKFWLVALLYMQCQLGTLKRKCLVLWIYQITPILIGFKARICDLQISCLFTPVNLQFLQSSRQTKELLKSVPQVPVPVLPQILVLNPLAKHTVKVFVQHWVNFFMIRVKMEELCAAIVTTMPLCCPGGHVW